MYRSIPYQNLKSWEILKKILSFKITLRECGISEENETAAPNVDTFVLYYHLLRKSNE